MTRSLPTRPLLTHVVEGEGSPLVLLNGGMMSHSSWDPVLGKLRGRHRILRFDFRGQLLSPGSSGAGGDSGGGLAAHAADVLELLEAVGWEQAHFVGTSFGAEVALELAAGRPELFRSQVAITAMDRETPRFRRDNDEMRAILEDILAGGSRQPFWDLLREGVYSEQYRRREESLLADRGAKVGLLPASYFAGVADILRAIEGFDFTTRLRRYDFPSLVVIAQGDRVMPPERSRALAAAIGAEVAVHPGSGHALVAEDPAWVGEVVHEFLERIDASIPDVLESPHG